MCDMKVQVIAFDFDGTLVESNAIKRNAFFETVRDHPAAATVMAHVLDENPEATRHQIFAALGRKMCPHDARAADSLAGDLTQRYTALTYALVASCPEVPGAGAALDDLARRGYELAVNSSTPTEALVDILDRRGWSCRFRSIRGGPATKNENLQHIAAELGFACENILMVGDREIDRRAARRAGCAFVPLVRPDSDFTEPVQHKVVDLAKLPVLLASPSALCEDC